MRKREFALASEGDKKDAATASFEESQVLGAKLASILSESCVSGEPMPSEAVDVLRTRQHLVRAHVDGL